MITQERSVLYTFQNCCRCCGYGETQCRRFHEVAGREVGDEPIFLGNFNHSHFIFRHRFTRTTLEY
jgi:hypothetical protein